MNTGHPGVAMIERARADHLGFLPSVASLTDLPSADETFDDVFPGYPTIHTEDASLPGILGECRRVLRPGGLRPASATGRLSSSGRRRHSLDIAGLSVRRGCLHPWR